MEYGLVREVTRYADKCYKENQQLSVHLKCVLKKEPYSLIFGPEASGLSDDFLEIGTPLIIKHNKMIDSLNLDNAVSIALYEFTKNEYF